MVVAALSEGTRSLQLDPAKIVLIPVVGGEKEEGWKKDKYSLRNVDLILVMGGSKSGVLLSFLLYFKKHTNWKAVNIKGNILKTNTKEKLWKYL